MGNIHLITAYAGEPHVASGDAGAFNASVLGDGEYILPVGNKLSATLVSNNAIRISDGAILMQGRFARISAGGTVSITVDNGRQGYNRNDLIVARYSKSSSTGVEDCNIVLIKGSETTGTASDPSYTHSDILSGNAITNDMPLYRVVINGINVVALVKVAQEMYSVGSHVTANDNPHGVTKAQVGLSNVDNTSDANKPVSTAVQVALNGKANVEHSHAYLPTAGGTMSGSTVLNGMVFLGDAVRGDELPNAGNEGRIFLKKL